jgi:D-3-phosphoglycerate dehydrogenase
LNYDDVYNALESGQLGGVGIDVFHTEPFPLGDIFLNHPKVVATPHVAGVTEVSYENMARIVAENVKKIMKGEVPDGFVN